MQCPHCQHSDQGVFLFHSIGRGDYLCNYCGETVNPRHPKRLGDTQPAMDAQEKEEIALHIQSMPKVFENNGRPRILEEERLKHRRETNRKSQRTYWANHPEARQRKRTDYSAYLDGEHFGIGRDKVHA
jgi:hypothetical protein